MKKIILLVLMLFAVSCTRQESTPIQADNADRLEKYSAQNMPSIKIDEKDRACAIDSDCELIATQCSCDCGQGINKNNVFKYAGKLDDMCKSYHGIMCKTLCNGEVKCVNRICTYSNK